MQIITKDSPKASRMVTEYTIMDGPIVPQSSGPGSMRVTGVTVTTGDNGYVDISVMGYSVTKNGERKSQGHYFYADAATVAQVRSELEEI